jgi:hypothetical protein
MTGNFLKTLLGWFQFNAGISFCIISNPSKDLPHLEGYRLTSALNFLASIHLSLEFADNQIQPQQCANDLYLMDLAISASFKPKQTNK